MSRVGGYGNLPFGRTCRHSSVFVWSTLCMYGMYRCCQQRNCNRFHCVKIWIKKLGDTKNLFYLSLVHNQFACKLFCIKICICHLLPHIKSMENPPNLSYYSYRRIYRQFFSIFLVYIYPAYWMYANYCKLIELLNHVYKKLHTTTILIQIRLKDLRL